MGVTPRVDLDLAQNTCVTQNTRVPGQVHATPTPAMLTAPLYSRLGVQPQLSHPRDPRGATQLDGTLSPRAAPLGLVTVTVSHRWGGQAGSAKYHSCVNPKK